MMRTLSSGAFRFFGILRYAVSKAATKLRRPGMSALAKIAETSLES